MKSGFNIATLSGLFTRFPFLMIYFTYIMGLSLYVLLTFDCHNFTSIFPVRILYDSLYLFLMFIAVLYSKHHFIYWLTFIQHLR